MTSVHDALSMELGLQELSPRSNGWNAIPMDVVCKAFVTEDPSRGVNADAFVKERLSFIELAFRMREEELAAYAAGLPQRIRDAKRRHAERAAALSKIGKPVIEQPDAIVAGLSPPKRMTQTLPSGLSSRNSMKGFAAPVRGLTTTMATFSLAEMKSLSVR
jgi:hypothetical protein